MQGKSTKYYSDKQEKAVAKSLKGRQVGGSGASAFSKGDVSLGHILIECKTSMTEKSSYSVKKEVLEKAHREALSMRKFFSVLAFNFGPNSDNYYVIDENTMKFLVEKVEEEYRDVTIR